VRLFEEVTGNQLSVAHVPQEALRAQYESATEPMQKTFAALMLNCVNGNVIDNTEAVRAFSIEPLKSVREYFEKSV
jgi:hypothetical protein